MSLTGRQPSKETVMRKGILIDIDTQNDFMKRGGALYVPEAEDIIPRVDDTLE